MTKRQKQILRFSKIIIIIVIIIIFIFTGFVLWIFNNKGSEPTVIIASFFAFMTGEILALAKLKLAEINNEGNNKNIKNIVEEEEKNGSTV